MGLADWLRRRRKRPRPAAHAALPFRLRYRHFRNLLAANDEILECIAAIEDHLAGEAPCDTNVLRSRIDRAGFAAFVMAKNLNLVSGRRYLGLYRTLARLDASLRAAWGAAAAPASLPPVVPLAVGSRAQAHALGGKMANLCEVRNRVGLPVPDGFVITTAAFDELVAHNGLQAFIASQLAALGNDLAGLEATSQAIQTRIRAAVLPDALAAAIRAAVQHMASERGADLRLAVRSSAGDEDGAQSFAGQYQTQLNVAPERVADAYLDVVASLYRVEAIAYRRRRGVPEAGVRMAVGCVEQIPSVAAGVLFSRDPTQSGAPRALVEAVPGQGASIAEGTASPDHFVLSTHEPHAVLERRLSEKAEMRVAATQEAAGLATVPSHLGHAACIDDERLRELARLARTLEDYFGEPQDIEWAMAEGGRLVVLQSRPMVCAEPPPTTTVPYLFPADAQVLVDDGVTACPGIASGMVVRVEGPEDLATVPPGAVLVSRHSSPTFVRIMDRIAAIVTEVGGKTGHMAIVAREFGVPTIVGATAASRLTDGSVVTVDATHALVAAGNLLPPLLAGQPPRRSRPNAALERVARLVCPLRLTDPEAPDFTPESCSSLHDVARFVHEKIFAEMFHFGDDVERIDGAHAARLRARLPFQLYVFDLGGAIAAAMAGRDDIRIDAITSAPLVAFLRGLTDVRIRWDRPRPVSFGGFLSVLGESMVGHPPQKFGLGRRSFAIASDRYLNFSTHAGYHFSTLDAYCGNSLGKNYIQFRFHGGAAAIGRRERRVRFVAHILDHLGFRTQTKGDLLTARLSKYPRADIEATLVTLGRLTACTRQLDMLMDDDEVVDQFVDAFLHERFDAFA